MKGRPIDQIVYECMFPKPKSSDVQNFQGLLQRQLVPEVRLETQAFYGHLSSQEAKYPGLDYSYKPHRIRLSRYPWHRRLFRAFDALRLTDSEIAGLTKWEGTRWAKERFEREQGIVIRDTTSDDIDDWVEPEFRVPTVTTNRQSDLTEIEETIVEAPESMDEDSDMEISQSVGLELNERLRAAVAQREAGNTSTVMDEEWEQWLKEVVEAGGTPFISPEFGFVNSAPDAMIPGTRPVPVPSVPQITHNTDTPNSTSTPTSTSTSTMHPRLLNAARLGQWHQIPDFLQNMVRQNLDSTQERSNTTTPPIVSSSQVRRMPPLPSSTTDVLRSPPRSGRRMLRHTPAFESDARG